MKQGISPGDILHINLTTGMVKKQAISETVARDFIGGFGFNNKLAYELIKPGTNALSPENVVIFGAGALGGSLAPATSKVMATARFPVTRSIGTAFGGSGGDALRQAGYSQVAVTGRAERPVFLRIFDDDVELCDAGELWGKDIWQTTDELWQRYGSGCSVIAIGPAGERQAGISFAYVNKLGHLGRGGLGAVMGAKNLKAVVVRGTKGVKVANTRDFMKLVNPLTSALMNLSYRADWLKVGSAIAEWGRSATWRRSTLREEDPYGPLEYEKLWRGSLACPSCPVACKFLLELDAGSVTPISGFGIAISVWKGLNAVDLRQVLELRDLCNRYGLDDVAASAVIDFALKLFEDGSITTEDTDGIELRRDYETARKLIGEMARKEGFGGLLADGLWEAASRLGKVEKGEASTIKGQEPFFEPRRHFHSWNITEVVNPRGTLGIAGNSPAYMPGHPPEDFIRYLRRLKVSETAIEGICTASKVNMARLAKHAEDWYSAISCLGICARQPVVQCYNIDIAAALYTAATGFELDAIELMKAGERAWNILKAANAREGFSRKDDRFPKVWFEPLVTEGKTLTLTDYYGTPLDKAAAERLLDDYYQERGWDIKTGIPTREKLLELGLEVVAGDLQTLIDG